MMIRKFENFEDDVINQSIIDDNSIIEYVSSTGDKYKHILVFVLPYHKNEYVGKQE